MIQPTLDKMVAMRLKTMADAVQTQLSNPEFVALSFEERLALLVDAQYVSMQDEALLLLCHINYLRCQIFHYMIPVVNADLWGIRC